MDKPSVFIITLNWNGLDETLECLASVQNLTYPTVTAIVVDNASRDNQAEAIEEAFPQAVVLKQSENLGFCGGCNVGISYALNNGADYVMLLNNDALVTSDLIEKLLEGAVALRNVSAVSPLILNYPNTDEIWFSRARWVTEEAQFRLSYPGESHGQLRDLDPYKSEFACGCCMLVPAELFEMQGILDERYFAFYDEADWCSRARRNGFESYVIPSAFIYHKVSRSTPSLVSTYLLTRNRLLWMKENLPLSERWKSLKYLAKELIWHSANQAGLTPSTYSKQHSKAVLQGYKDYFRGRFHKWSVEAEAIIFPSGQ